MADELTGYCLKCKEHRVMVDPRPEWAANGTPATRGTCAVCGTNMYLRGQTPAHDALPRPEVSAAPPAAKATKATKTKPAAKGKSTAKAAKSQRAKPAAARTPARAAADTSDNGQRSGKLVVVESPAKAKTIGKYLGRGYVVKSSVGHVRDLLKSRLSVDVDNSYEPEYRVPNDKRKVVNDLKAAAAKASQIFLATDPDREGEAIAWHVLESAEMDPHRTQRVVFQEITKGAVQRAFEEPREIDMQRVNAQQARRILDRLVGYQLSPLLWRKVKGRLSAGRVQSVAVRLVVEREREIEAFTTEEYWSLQADLSQAKQAGRKKRVSFRARWHKFNGEDFALNSEAAVAPHLAALQQATWTVHEVKTGTRRRRPQAPFTTSTLQQEASRKFGFGTTRTMKVAQDLYEGIDLGSEGTVGLITYMRTDSVNVSQEAQQEARRYITTQYSAEHVPDEIPVYKTRSKTAQEAHEAVRPTSVFRTPETMKQHLSREQYNLYSLIWARFVASQMAPAVYATVAADIYAGAAATPVTQRPYHFRATGSLLKFDGFLRVYEETEPLDRPEDGTSQVPDDLADGEALDLLKLLPEQHFTQPPPRFSEATLVKALEENGVGRPSTYASIISTIISRGYVVREAKRLQPTDIGRMVNDLLVEHFPDVLSVDFTAQLEDELDEIAEGNAQWTDVVDHFYQPFHERLAVADQKLPKLQLKTEPDYVGRVCPTCGVGQLVYREGRYGRFIGCERFPACRHTEQILVKVGVTCPVGGGELIEKKTGRGRTFYGCARYPDCQWSSWTKPLRSEGDQIIVETTKNGDLKATACELKPEARGEPELTA